MGTARRVVRAPMLVKVLAVVALSAAAVAGGVFSSAEPAQAACSERDAANTALQRVGGGWAVIGVFYDASSGGFWVNLVDGNGRQQQVFVRWSC